MSDQQDDRQDSLTVPLSVLGRALLRAGRKHNDLDLIRQGEELIQGKIAKPSYGTDEKGRVVLTGPGEGPTEPSPELVRTVQEAAARADSKKKSE